MSDSDFDDDDDEAVLQLMQMTQMPAGPTGTGPEPAQSLTSPQLFRAQGEIAILRAQLEALQKLKSEEASRLNNELYLSRNTAKDQIEALKSSVDKLEDEKRFLRNEVQSLTSKRRKLPVSGVDVLEATNSVELDRLLLMGANSHAVSRRTTECSSSSSSSTKPSGMVNSSGYSTPATISEVPIQIQDDWLQLCHHLWQYTINGSDRTSMEFLSRICVPQNVELDANFHIVDNLPLLSQLWDRFILLRHLRLDGVVTKLCEQVLTLVNMLLDLYHGGNSNLLLSVPFLISIVYAAVSYKPLAVTGLLTTKLIRELSQLMRRFTFVLQLNNEEEEALLGHENVTYQQRLLENFTLTVGLDLLECLSVISTLFGAEFVRDLWLNRVFDLDLLHGILPENPERFVATVQINTVFNAVEIYFSSLTEVGFATGNKEHNIALVKSLIKAFLMDIDIKADFSFYGLNRIIGNNNDFKVLSDVVPETLPSFVNTSFTSVPCPVYSTKHTEKEAFEVKLVHDCHLLSLRIRIATLLEGIIVSGMTEVINLKENIKLLVRVIGFEQNLMIHQPRYPYIYMRVQLIGTLVRILYYILDEHKNINTLIYPETLYEILVVLMRIAFGPDSLSIDAHALLVEVRKRGALDLPVFNRECELRSRELAHINRFDNEAVASGEMAEAEADYANGLEFGYDSETIEISREILGICLNHEEADNLYYNMTSQEG